MPQFLSKSWIPAFAGMTMFLFLFIFPTQAQAANRFWVTGGNGNWSSSTNWATTSGGSSGAAAPTSADAVTFDASSGSGTATVDTSSAAGSLDMTSFTGTLAGNQSLIIALNVPATGNVTFGSGMTMTYSGQFAIRQSSGTVVLTTNGKVFLGSFNVNCNAATVQLGDNLTVTGGFSETSGSMDFNNKTVNFGSFTFAGTAARTMTFGSSTINITGTSGTLLSQSTASNTTNAANTATINFTGITGTSTIDPGNVNWNGTSIVVTPPTAATVTMSSSPTFANITLNGPASQSQVYSFTAGVTWTATSAITTAGNSISNRIRVASATRGTAVTLAASTWTNSNTDFEDITASGTFSGGAATVGDLGGNSGTFAGRTPTTYYWVSGTGSYSDTTKWSLTSNGSSASTIPLPQDTARFDASSFTAGSQTITFDVVRNSGIDFTGATNTPSLANSGQPFFYGDFILIGGMGISSLGTPTMAKRGTSTFNTNGRTFGGQAFVVDAPSGTVNLANNVSGLNSFRVLSGTFNSNSYNISTTAQFIMGGGSAQGTINLGSSTITITGSNPNIISASSTNLIFNAGASRFILNGSGTTNFQGAGLTYYDVQIQGTGTITFTSSNTFHSLTASATARTIIFTAGTTQTITGTNGFIRGASGAVQTLQSSSSGTAWNISSTLPQSLDYLSIQDSTATKNNFYAGNNSTNVSGNTNWIFTAPGYSITPPGAYWKLDDGTGTTAKDATSNANNGTLTNGPVWQTEDQCISGKCLFFDGSTNYVEVPAVGMTVLNGSNIWTIGVWFKNNGRGTFAASWGQPIIDKQTVSHDFRLEVMTDGSLRFRSFESGGVNLIDSSTNYKDNKWHYAVVVKSSSSQSNNGALYVDGILKVSGDIRNVITTSTNLRLGYTNSSDGAVQQHFSGFIDEPKIYGYARTQAQIRSDYNARGSSTGTSAVLGASNNTPNALSNGLVGYWKMDETPGSSSAADSSGNSNTGTYTSGATTAVGKFGNGGSLDGVDDYVLLPNNTSLQFSSNSSPRTFAGWINVSSCGTYPILISGNSRDELRLLNNTCKPEFLSVDGNSTAQASSAISLNTWHHLVGVFDGTKDYIYVDGALAGTNTPTPNGSPGQMQIGARLTPSSCCYLPGKVDDVRVYNRALSGADVQALYNFAPGPVGYWDFENGSGSSVTDKSGLGNTGTFSGSSNHWVPGKYGKAGNFVASGSDSVLSTMSSGLMPNGNTALTISGWIYYAVSPGASTQDMITFGAGAVAIGSRSSSLAVWKTGGIILASTTFPSAGAWHFVSYTFDGTTNSLYVDGVLANTSTTSPSSSNLVNAYFGSNTGSNEFFSGKLDEIKLYNYIRTSGQIIQDMNGGHPAPGSPVGTPLGYWKFDEGFGTTANNYGSQGSTLNGTLTNMASPATSTSGWTGSGKFNKAINFDGSNDYIDAGSSIAPSSGITLSAWINSSNLSSTRMIISKRTGTNNWHFLTDSSGKLNIAIFDSSGNAICASVGNTTLSTGVWYHVAGTYDGTNCKVYVNSQLDNTTSGAGTMGTNGTNITIGTQTTDNNQGRNWSGKLDEVKVFNFALTPDQIKLDMNRGSTEVLGALGDNSNSEKGSASQEYCIPGDSSTCTAPVARWDFEEGSGTTAQDSSGNANTGTLTNGPVYKPGKVGKSIKFDGVDDYVAFSDSSMTKTLPFTVETWFKTNALSSTTQGIVNKYKSSGVNGFNLFLSTSTNKLCAWYFKDGSNHVEIAQAESQGSNACYTVSANTWYHTAVTVTSTGMTMYVNGTLWNTGSWTGTAGNSTETGVLRIGTYPDASDVPTRFFNGQIDQTRIFNYARSASQVAWDYNKGAPVGYWKLDDCSGSSVIDSSGNGNTGTITIGATGTYTALGNCNTSSASSAWFNGATGKRNYSLAFDGTDDRVDIPSSTSLNAATNAISVSAWIYSTNNSSIREIVSKRTAQNNWQLYLSSGQVTFFTYNSSHATNCQVNGSTILSTNTWYHVVGTYDSATSTCNVYFNSILNGTSSGAGVVPADGTVITIGAQDTSNSNGRNWSGQIDDVRVYNYALTASQVKLLYNGGGLNFAPLTGAP